MGDGILTVVHVVDGYSQNNHGVIEAALSTANILRDDFQIHSELWVPGTTDESHDFDLRGAELVPIAGPHQVAEIVRKRSISRRCAVAVTHGCWQSPTSIGARLKKIGFPWVYVPHGMLEPWSLSQKSLRKWVYWHLRERRLALSANVVRATSVPEKTNLDRIFSNVSLITHGIPMGRKTRTETDLVTVLFMGRLHPKKGASKLAESWVQSRLHLDSGFRLVIVGYDDGDLPRLNRILEKTKSNIELLDPVYGEEKFKLFSSSHFFALPSHSEGFPVALLEGMASGLVPIISEGCNFPEALEKGIGIRVNPDLEEITAGLDMLKDMDRMEVEERRNRTRQLMREKFSLKAIAEQQANLYRSLVS